MGGIGTILALLVGGILYSQARIAPFAFGSIVMLTAIAMVLLFVNEPKTETERDNPESGGNFFDQMKEVVKSTDRSGFMILLAILCWFLGWKALETWISSFGKYTLGINEGLMAILTSSLALMFVISAIPAGLIATRFGRKRVIMVGYPE